MELTDEEVDIILERRIAQQENLIRILKNEECNHEWHYVANNGRDTLFECEKCGEREWG